MEIDVKNIIIKFIAFLMIGIMGMFIADRAIFLHSHKLNNGIIITHAHPYDKSNDSKPYKSHHHTNSQYLLFQRLEVLFFVVFLTFALFVLVKKEKIPFCKITRHALSCIILHKGRAPPIS